MKDNWSVIPFEEAICKVKYTKKIANSEYLSQGLFPIISQEDDVISGYWNNKEDVFSVTSPVVIFGDHTRVLKYVDFDFVLGADGVKILLPIKGLDAKFFMYYLNSCKIPSLGYSRHYKLLKELNVPIPSFEEQTKIVEELDQLSNIIEKQRQQLSELDNLAQSIFYDMFGDPVTNEKGWEIITLGHKCEVTSFKRVLIEDVVDEGIPFIRGTELMALSRGEDVDFSLFITQEHYDLVSKISGVPKKGDLLIPSINAEARIWILNTNQPRYYKDGRVLWVHVNEDLYTSECLKYIMQELIKSSYSTFASGATFAELKLFVLRELLTILPPLSLQQLFAQKIEAIEQEKEIIKQSIAETEELFNSRMDYYFG